MLDISKIREFIEVELNDTDLFVVDIRCAPDNTVEVLLDSDSSVGIDDCIRLSRAINTAFDRDEEDYELTVSSAGIGQPLKVLRQYKKLIGKPVEAVLKNGTKITATLKDAAHDNITLAYTEKVSVEGKKRKQDVQVEKTYCLTEIKSVREFLDYK